MVATGGMSTGKLTIDSHFYKVEFDKCKADRDRLSAELAEARESADEFLAEMISAQQRWIDRGRELDALREDLALRAKSYDANVQGYLADIRALRQRIAGLEALVGTIRGRQGVLHDIEELVLRRQAEREEIEKP